MAEAGNAGDAPVEGTVEDVLIGREAGANVVRCGKFATPEKRGNEEDVERCAGGNSTDVSEGVGRAVEGWGGAVFEVIAELLPELRTETGASEGGEDIAAVLVRRVARGAGD